jgi:hypothetical protein
MLRQLAYRENSPLLPPETDPEGWRAIPPIIIRGSVFTSRNVDVKGTLFLANPLSYTRGSVIPLFLTLTSSDAQVLNLLTSSKAASVRLVRRVKYSMNGSDGRESVDFLENAVWWPANDGGGDRLNRRMCGEIRLVKDLKPSCSIGHFSLEVSFSH